MTIKLFDTTLKINIIFVAIIAVVVILDKTNVALLGILASVLHELTHIITMFFCNSRPFKIILTPFGAKIIADNSLSRSYLKDIIISLSAPLLNLLIFIVFSLINNFFANDYLMQFALVNLFVGLFNLLPIISLDGGNALYSLLCMKLTENKSFLIVNIISFLILIPIATLGFFLLLKSRYNFTLLLTSLYLMFIIIFKRKD